MEAVTESVSQEVANEGQIDAQIEAQENQESKVKATEARRLGEQDFDALVSVKINGETKELPLREVIKLNQLESASHQKMQEASKLVRQVESIIKMARQSPKDFLKETGIDPYEFAESTLAEKFELMQLTPEQKELMEYKQRLKSYEEKDKAEKETQEKAQLSRAESEEMGRLDVELGEAWKESGLPKSKYIFAQMAARMLSASKRGQDLTAKQAADSVKQEFISSSQEIFGKMDAQAIQDILGKELMKKIRDFDVKRVTGKTISDQKQGPAKAASEAKKTFKSESEWREAIAQISKGLKD